MTGPREVPMGDKSPSGVLALLACLICSAATEPAAAAGDSVQEFFAGRQVTEGSRLLEQTGVRKSVPVTTFHPKIRSFGTGDANFDTAPEHTGYRLRSPSNLGVISD